MTTFKLTLAYDGTDFVGWQRQSTGRSVQGLLEDALGRLDGAPVAVIGAGRTDAGVHALGQVASATLRRDLDANVLRRAVNAHLPADVRVIDVAPAAPEFHARAASHSKTYRYRIITGEVMDPFDRRTAWHVPGSLDSSAMHRAAVRFEGEHDFAAFQSSGGTVTGTVRKIKRSCVSSASRPDGSVEITYDIVGNGFLRHMVRAIVGTLVDVGAGRLGEDAIEAILTSRSRQHAGPNAPAHGLFLVEVSYGRPQPRTGLTTPATCDLPATAGKIDASCH